MVLRDVEVRFAWFEAESGGGLIFVAENRSLYDLRLRKIQFILSLKFDFELNIFYLDNFSFDLVRIDEIVEFSRLS